MENLSELFLNWQSSRVSKQVDNKDDRNNLKRKRELREKMLFFFHWNDNCFRLEQIIFRDFFSCPLVLFLELMSETIKQNKGN